MWDRLDSVKRSGREGGLACPSSLTKKKEDERVRVLSGKYVRGTHTDVRQELLKVLPLPTADAGSPLGSFLQQFDREVGWLTHLLKLDG